MKIWMTVLVLCCAVVLGALDRDFSIRSDGRELPEQLQVFRRDKGYVIVLNSRKEAQVFARCQGKSRFVLDTEKTEFLIRREKPVFVWFVPDRSSKLNDQQLLEISCRFKGGKQELPRRGALPFIVNGRKGRAYSWNNESGTILEQVSNVKLEFQDPAFDVTGSCCADLISGRAEVQGDTLLLTARLKQAADCDMRVWIDSIPEEGYSGDGTDFMINNHQVSRFSGSRSNQWKWENVFPVKFKKEGTVYTWSVPLEKIRKNNSGRLRLRFQSLCRKAACKKSQGDYMPGHGKILPVLRPGNRAAANDTRIEVSGSYPQYKIYPLTDGQTAKQMHWSYESFAAASSSVPRWVAFLFAKPEKVNQVIVWWDSVAGDPALQVMDKQGKWVDVPVSFAARGDGKAPQSDNETGALVQQQTGTRKKDKSILLLPPGTETSGVRLLERKKNGTLWVREIEIY